MRYYLIPEHRLLWLLSGVDHLAHCNSWAEICTTFLLLNFCFFGTCLQLSKAFHPPPPPLLRQNSGWTQICFTRGFPNGTNTFPGTFYKMYRWRKVIWGQNWHLYLPICGWFPFSRLRGEATKSCWSAFLLLPGEHSFLLLSFKLFLCCLGKLVFYSIFKF